MAVYIVSYDLNKVGQDYTKVYEVIKSFNNWCHPLDSTWLVYEPSSSANSSASKIASKIKEVIDQNDRFLVMKVTSDYAGWLAQDFWDWIEKYLAL